MKKFEYHIAYISLDGSTYTFSNLGRFWKSEDMKALGAEGWELVSCIPDKYMENNYVCFFKREL